MMGEERRREERHATQKEGSIVFEDGTPNVGCTIKDLSDAGAGLEISQRQDVPKRFLLAVSGSRSRPCEVAWSSETRLGVRFIDVPSQAPPMADAADKTDLRAELDDLRREMDALRDGLDRLRDRISGMD